MSLPLDAVSKSSAGVGRYAARANRWEFGSLQTVFNPKVLRNLQGRKLVEDFLIELSKEERRSPK